MDLTNFPKFGEAARDYRKRLNYKITRRSSIRWEVYMRESFHRITWLVRFGGWHPWLAALSSIWHMRSFGKRFQ